MKKIRIRACARNLAGADCVTALRSLSKGQAGWFDGAARVPFRLRAGWLERAWRRRDVDRRRQVALSDGGTASCGRRLGGPLLIFQLLVLLPVLVPGDALTFIHLGAILVAPPGMVNRAHIPAGRLSCDEGSCPVR